MRAARSAGAIRVQAILGDAYQVLEFYQSTHTSAEAAAVIGCDTGTDSQVDAVSRRDGWLSRCWWSPPASNRVDEAQGAALIGQKDCSRRPRLVLRHTGFAVGGVPPIGHATPPVYVPRSGAWQVYLTIWAAAGSANRRVRSCRPDDGRV